MSKSPRIDDLKPADIHAALTAAGNHLTEEQARALKEFVVRVGGVENAKLAIQRLSTMQKAA